MAVSPSGKDKLLRHARIYVGGYDLSGDSRSVSNLDNTFGEVDASGWSELVRNYLPDHMLQAGIRGYQAILNDATGRAFDQLKDAENTSQLSFCFGGGGEPAVPDPAYILPSIQMNDIAGFDSSLAVLSGVDFIPDASQMTDNFQAVMGNVLHGEGDGALSATLAASSSNSIDNGASSANGFIAIIHIIATASGNFAFKIRHSTDDSAWADLVTFSADGSTVTSELASGSGTVNRYVAFDAARTGGTVTAICTFVRN